VYFSLLRGGTGEKGGAYLIFIKRGEGDDLSNFSEERGKSLQGKGKVFRHFKRRRWAFEKRESWGIILWGGRDANENCRGGRGRVGFDSSGGKGSLKKRKGGTSLKRFFSRKKGRP